MSEGLSKIHATPTCHPLLLKKHWGYDAVRNENVWVLGMTKSKSAWHWLNIPGIPSFNTIDSFDAACSTSILQTSSLPVSLWLMWSSSCSYTALFNIRMLSLPLCKLAMFPLFDIAFLKSQSATPTFAGWALDETWQKTFCSGQVQKFFTLARTTTWLPSFSTPCPLQLVRSAPWFASLRVLPCLSQSRDSDLPADPAVWSSDLESHLWRFQTKRVLGSVTFVQSIIFPSAFAKEMWPALVTWTVHWSHCLTIGTWRPVLIPSVHPASNCSTYQASYHRRPDKWSSTEHYLATGIVFVAAEVD